MYTESAGGINACEIPVRFGNACLARVSVISDFV